VRNTLNDLIWIGGLVGYIGLNWWIHGLIGGGHAQVIANLAVIPLTAAFLAWSGRILSAKRIEWRLLLPFAILGGALGAVCEIAAGVYLPHLFSSYASRFGVIGAVLAMISALFALMVALVASAAVGREISVELDRIDRGERPPDDEVRREWEVFLDQARSRWQTLRDQIDRLRHRDRQPR
jgi:membrane protein